jgi:hypothetical protein
MWIAAALVAGTAGAAFAEEPRQERVNTLIVPQQGELRLVLPEGIGVVNHAAPLAPGLPVGRVQITPVVPSYAPERQKNARLIPIEPMGRVELIPLDVRVRMLLIGR